MKTPADTPPSPPARDRDASRQWYSEAGYGARLLLGALLIVALIKGVALLLPVVPLQIGWVLLLLLSPALAMMMWLDGQRWR
ncbi:MAG: hypothetical protein EA367_08625 [Leptolyngbya sp. DLM2.Bin15]|nr:MAG: hypothetical protein EA367_08625 [Leptolyngbya sp. DLM2.Bin15]